MDDWDQDKLDEVVRQKHGTEKNRPTDIICKFFLDAVEKKTYGWWGRCSLATPCSLMKSSDVHRCSQCFSSIAGSGSVPTERSANTGMLCRRAMFSSPR